MTGAGDNSSTRSANVSLFDALYGEHHRAIYSYLVGQCGSSDSAQDLLQETYLRVWRHIEDARRVPCANRRYWLIAIARSAAIDHGRRRAVRCNLEAPLPADSAIPVDDRSDPESLAVDRETAIEAAAAIARLPLDLRVALSMTLLGEMTSREIGGALGIPAGTVRYRVALARERLAKDLGMHKSSAGENHRET